MIMSEIDQLLERVADALMISDSESALRWLGDIERQVNRDPDLIGPDMHEKLKRISDLAHAVEQGIVETRALIENAENAARSVNTYDDEGKPSTVTRARPALGRF